MNPIPSPFIEEWSTEYHIVAIDVHYVETAVFLDILILEPYHHAGLDLATRPGDC